MHLGYRNRFRPIAYRFPQSNLPGISSFTRRVSRTLVWPKLFLNFLDPLPLTIKGLPCHLFLILLGCLHQENRIRQAYYDPCTVSFKSNQTAPSPSLLFEFDSRSGVRAMVLLAWSQSVNWLPLPGFPSNDLFTICKADQ